MKLLGLRQAQRIVLIALTLGIFGTASPSAAQSASSNIDIALQNITTLVRPGRIGYATIWDGNKYVQCRRTAERNIRCEAAGSTLQSSLKRVLTNERLSKLDALGWTLDLSFGNYVRTFPSEMPTSRAADHVLQVLTEVYDADPAALEFQTAWVTDTPCPPRNGPSQNLAGAVNDAPSMRSTALRTCSYAQTEESPQKAASSPKELVSLHGASTAAEIQRLRVNASRRIYVVFNAGIGYIQCMPESISAIYCEAQSAESWPALTSVLTPKRISKLRNAGYADPGRTPNYSKTYPLNKFSDADLANELLTILYDVYGYTGAMKLKITTE